MVCCDSEMINLMHVIKMLCYSAWQVHAVRTKTGELKFFSAAEESDTDVPKVV